MNESRLAVLIAAVLMTAIVGTAAAANLLVQPANTGQQNPTATTSASLTSAQPTTTTTTTTTPTTTITTTTTTTSSGPPPDLLLRLELNSTVVASGATVGINVSDYNPFPTELNLSKEDAWPVQGLGTGGCPSLYYPFGIEVLHGVYTSSNVSQGAPLEIFPVVACPMIVMYITGYLFQPMSDNATVLPGTGELAMATTVSAGGTYGMSGSQFNQLTPFSPGTYTVVAGDEWGNLAFSYFTVVAPPA
jgi:hypothetical protein